MRLESEYRVEEQSSNPFLIQLTLFGPSGSIYEGGRFKV
jgi:ubiquitin-protein ligase